MFVIPIQKVYKILNIKFFIKFDVVLIQKVQDFKMKNNFDFYLNYNKILKIILFFESNVTRDRTILLFEQPKTLFHRSSSFRRKLILYYSHAEL